MSVSFVCPSCGETSPIFGAPPQSSCTCLTCGARCDLDRGPRPALASRRQPVPTVVIVLASAAFGVAALAVSFLMVLGGGGPARPSQPVLQNGPAVTITARAPAPAPRVEPAGHPITVVPVPIPVPAPPPVPVAAEDSDEATEPPAARALTTAEVAERCEGGVALIRGKVSSGTGFLAAPGLVVTNAHVIEDEFLADLKVRFPSAADAAQGPFEAILMYEDARRDLAVLRLKPGAAEPPIPLEVAASYTFRKGDEVTVIGNPGIDGTLTLENAISRGLMSTRTTLDGLAFYQLGIAINPGNSGGPVLDANGRVIGVATLKAARQEGLAFCIPVEDAQAALRVAASRPSQEASQVAGRHRLTVLARLLCQEGDAYSAGLDRCSRAVDEALRKGNATPATLQAAAHLVVARIDEIHDALLAGLEAEIPREDPDAPIDALAREALARLAANNAAMKRHLQSRPDHRTLRAKALELGARHRGAVLALKSAVGPAVADRLDGSAPQDDKAPAGIPGVVAGPEVPAAEATLSVVDLTFSPEYAAGYVKIRGKLRNSSAAPVSDLSAVIRVLDETGQDRNAVRVSVVPKAIAPGGLATFFTRTPIFTRRDHYKVDFVSKGGRPVAVSGPAEK